MNDSVYAILVHDYNVLIPIGYEKDLNTAKAKVRTFLNYQMMMLRIFQFIITARKLRTTA